MYADEFISEEILGVLRNVHSVNSYSVLEVGPNTSPAHRFSASCPETYARMTSPLIDPRFGNFQIQHDDDDAWRTDAKSLVHVDKQTKH
jgi:hypothetical protein